MERLDDILAAYGQAEPPELIAIKRYVSEHYHIDVHARISGNTIVVTVPSAALANTLRLQVPYIKETCRIEKQLVLRIS